MRIGGSLILIAVGAILKFAVTTTMRGVSVQTIGVILMIVGLAWLLFELIWWTSRRGGYYSRTTAAPYAAPVTPVVQQPVTPVVQRPVVQRTYVQQDPYVDPY